ncbi:phage tail sheath subtilisin-like domain-containing protein [Amycolatopsis sp. FBCC-B4732]|uniref:phage tail sheath family protein n=1 Tax=Amycolatopsis sp. FBCC-B4732 TaxID=3079339 RepID=UPI001FF5F978|nr:phage tail sheath C-terminal domain-containing protein [Amycolatopsis sp. FBCC-B4732]UOX92730.1 phage tail sheath subtilisin-like domain-containing protein [Amycolatopsis sp. FBCC-B4732]
MPEYLSPGVYVEEVDAGPRPIAGVSTSTAGMVGVTQRGPTGGKPKLVTNFLEFQTTFGGFLPEPDPAIRDAWAENPAEGGRWWLFPLAVKGFFDNGGQRLYVKRVASETAQAASGTLGTGLVSAITRDAAAGAKVLELAHLVGFTGSDEVKVFRGSDNVEIGTVTITAYDAAKGRVTLGTGLPAEVKAARGDYVQKAPRVATPSLRFSASSPGSWGKAVQVRISPSVSASLPVLPDPNEGPLFITALAAEADADAGSVQVDAVPGLDPDDLPDDVWILIGNRRFPVTVAQPEAGKVTLTFPDGTHHAPWKTGLTVRRVRRANAGAGPKLRISGSSRLYEGALAQLDTGDQLSTLTVVAIEPDEVVTFGADTPALVFETARLLLVESTVDTRFGDPGGGSVTETFRNLRLTGDAPGTVTGTLASQSRLVRATALDLSTDPTEFPTPATGSWLSLADDGDDAFGGLDVGDFVGTDGGSGKRTGIVALEDIDEIAICAVPGVWAGTVESALVTHCEQLKDRFAVLDPRDGLDIEGIQEFREPFDTKYAALYYPWLVVNDPSTNQFVEVPPSGHMIGIYARTDVERGVHKAPANAVIRGIRLTDGIAQDVTKRHQDLLNPRGINALRFFPGLGQRVWGARTLSSDTSWKYINVRRLFLFLEESIDEGTQWVVFEPNDESLWALVRQTVANFLTTVWRSGALAGTTADEAFFVHCDRSTMTDDDIANGRLICVIGVAPVFPAEFVIFRIQQKTREPQLV